MTWSITISGPTDGVDDAGNKVTEAVIGSIAAAVTAGLECTYVNPSPWDGKSKADELFTLGRERAAAAGETFAGLADRQTVYGRPHMSAEEKVTAEGEQVGPAAAYPSE